MVRTVLVLDRILEHQAPDKPQHQHRPNDDPRELEYSDLVPAGCHASHPRRGALETRAHGGEGVAL